MGQKLLYFKFYNLHYNAVYPILSPKVILGVDKNVRSLVCDETTENLP